MRIAVNASIPSNTKSIKSSISVDPLSCECLFLRALEVHHDALTLLKRAMLWAPLARGTKE